MALIQKGGSTSLPGSGKEAKTAFCAERKKERELSSELVAIFFHLGPVLIVREQGEETRSLNSANFFKS